MELHLVGLGSLDIIGLSEEIDGRSRVVQRTRTAFVLRART